MGFILGGFMKYLSLYTIMLVLTINAACGMQTSKIKKRVQFSQALECVKEYSPEVVCAQIAPVTQKEIISEFSGFVEDVTILKQQLQSFAKTDLVRLQKSKRDVRLAQELLWHCNFYHGKATTLLKKAQYLNDVLTEKDFPEKTPMQKYLYSAIEPLVKISIQTKLTPEQHEIEKKSAYNV
jgi:hypothetical protein